MRINLIFPETRIVGLHFLSLIVWVFSAFKFVHWAPKDASFLRQSAFWPKVGQGHSGSSKVDDFGTNRKRVCNFLLVINSNFGPILHRFWDTATYWLKIAYFSYPSLIRRPRSLGSLLNFTLKLTMRKLESWGYLQWRPHDRSLSRFDTVPACDRWTDRQTDRQTDGFTIANTALCIASYADAL